MTCIHILLLQIVNDDGVVLVFHNDCDRIGIWAVWASKIHFGFALVENFKIFFFPKARNAKAMSRAKCESNVVQKQ